MGPSLPVGDPGSVPGVSPACHKPACHKPTRRRPVRGPAGLPSGFQIQSLRRKVMYSTTESTIISAVEA